MAFVLGFGAWRISILDDGGYASLGLPRSDFGGTGKHSFEGDAAKAVFVC